MKKTNGLREKGISLRILHIAMVACAVVICVLLVYSTYQSGSVFSKLSKATGNYITRQKAAHDLMEASDYLTENVQRFTLTGDVKYLNQYFEEANVSKRRDQALITMSENNADENLVRQLQEALEESQDLMDDEKYAMILVIDALGITKYPDDLKPLVHDLDKDDEFKSAEEKIKLAQDKVMGDEYYASKEIIRTKLKNSLEMMDDQMAATRRKTSADMMRELSANRVVVIVLVAVLGILILLTALLSTIPLINSHRKMMKNERLPITGSKEFREMSEKYNEIYDQLHPKDAE